jgi:hypothetical protein
MSQLIKRLNEVNRQAIGLISFTNQSIKRRRFCVIVELTSMKVCESLEGMEFDAAYLNEPDSTRIITLFKQLKESIPVSACGVKLNKEVDISGLLNEGCDFFIVQCENSHFELSEIENLGVILMLDASLSSSYLKAIDGLDVDAFMVDFPQSFLTWGTLAKLRRISGLISKPIIVGIHFEVDKPTIKAVWNTGVAGIVVKLGDEDKVDKLKTLLEYIDSVEITNRSPEREKARAILPITKVSESVG